MSQDFRLKYDELSENDLSHREFGEGMIAHNETYPDPGHGRSICFVLLDGKRLFLGYGYIISGEYTPEEGTIVLTFSTHSILLKGVNLEKLFYNIQDQRSKQIVCVDSRYNLIGEDEQFVVNEIQVKIANKL